MAASSKPVGHECEFVDQVPEDYFCKQCKHVAREPNIISCCGEVLCKGCVDLILQDKEPCPSCGDLETSAVPHVKYHQKIGALKVRCIMKGHGCQWTGQLQHLDAHLHVTNGDCQYVNVDCSKQCGQKVQKHNVDTHLADHCPNWDHRCQHCVLSDAGCEAKFICDNQDEHTEQNTQKLLAFMAATTLRIRQAFERKLKEQQQDFQHKQEVLERKFQEQQNLFDKKLRNQNEQVVQKLNRQCLEMQMHMVKRDEQIKVVQEKLQTTSQTLKQQQDAISQIHRGVSILPYDIILSNYQQLKVSNDSCNSPPMDTHPNGYKFKLIIYPSGLFSGSDVRVYVNSLKSDHDAELPFPVQFTITLQLLNQHRDQNHHTREIKCEIEKREYVGYWWRDIGSEIEFIPQAQLKWNTDKQTQYLKDDCLRFRIIKIV